jgi:hypothetical protein
MTRLACIGSLVAFVLALGSIVMPVTIFPIEVAFAGNNDFPNSGICPSNGHRVKDLRNCPPAQKPKPLH